MTLNSGKHYLQRSLIEALAYGNIDDINKDDDSDIYVGMALWLILIIAIPSIIKCQVLFKMHLVIQFSDSPSGM